VFEVEVYVLFGSGLSGNRFIRAEGAPPMFSRPSVVPIQTVPMIM